jgi:hypothetical protein
MRPCHAVGRELGVPLPAAPPPELEVPLLLPLLVLVVLVVRLYCRTLHTLSRPPARRGTWRRRAEVSTGGAKRNALRAAIPSIKFAQGR